MVTRSLLFVFGICALTVAFVPRGDGSTAANAGGDAATNGAAGSANPADKASLAWYEGEHTLVRESDGHFYANVDVTGSSLRMMVDTGASVVALTASDAAAAGLSWTDSDIQLVGRGASGDVFGVPALLADVEVGGLTARNVQAVIIPEGLDVSLLGQSYLSAIANVEIAEDRMVLSAQ